MTYYNEEDLREQLLEVIKECKHDEVVREDGLVFCIVCDAANSYSVVRDEDGSWTEEYGEWEPRYEILEKIPTDELIERVKEVKKT